ncbi:serine hydrolase [Bacteriovorax sp. DB6_IX]|uniref:serine hydrolase n=1 Tax=Bacteriovorax sp. DB6_IX TaxID=1353530 RepID=UPI00038A0FC1|nr:serine hydrolase [Bacteriovorax sp. DB6_IX]EQC51069.1 putative beta-lactamase [Bacteriovorax sp. DB6_IX]
MISKIEEYCLKNISNHNFNCIAVGVIDFESKEFETIQITSEDHYEDVELYFDLASMTKPLTFGVAYLAHPEIFDQNMHLLLTHRSGLPRWGRLSKSSWKEQILSYEISESETVYSDFGALRLQLEIEKKTGTPLYDISSTFWDKKVKHWTDLELEVSPITGRRNRKLISGEVHDDNAYIIGEKISHAGLFASIEGVCKTLLNLDNQLDLLKTIGVDHEGRYCFGWDTVEDPEKTLAGAGASKNTFGHLGFTGTSMWIDPEAKKGHVILTNETQGYWYDRLKLNKLRREIGSLNLNNSR